MRRRNPDAFEPELGIPVLPGSPSEIVRVLGGVITDARLERVRRVAAGRTRRVIPVLEGLTDPHNGSAILRSADAFGIAEVHIVPGPNGFYAGSTVAKGTTQWLDLQPHDTSEACADALTSAGYSIYAASMEGEARLEDLAKLDKVAIVFGNEHRGPSAAMRARATGTYAIPMRGFVESLNVSVAAAITLHGVVADRPSELTDVEQELLVARMLFRTVPDAAEILADRL